MCISKTNFIVMTILLVYVFHTCYAPLDEYGEAMCKAEIKRVFEVKKENPSGRSFAVYAFKYLREDDTCFLNASNNTTYNYAKIYYQTIRKNNYIYPATYMLLPNQYCDTNPAVNFHAYVELRTGKHIVDPIEACKTQMDLNGIPNIDIHQEILNYIYDNIVLSKLNNFQDRYVVHYVNILDKQFNAPSTMKMEDFCRIFNTTEEQPPNLRMNTVN